MTDRLRASRDSSAQRTCFLPFPVHEHLQFHGSVQSSTRSSKTLSLTLTLDLAIVCLSLGWVGMVFLSVTTHLISWVWVLLCNSMMIDLTVVGYGSYPLDHIQWSQKIIHFLLPSKFRFMVG